MKLKPIWFAGLSLLMVAACGSEDADIDAEFADFCEKYAVDGADDSCADPSSISTAQKWDILNDVPKLEGALEDMEGQIEADIKRIEDGM